MKNFKRLLSEIELGDYEFAPERADLGDEQKRESNTQVEASLFNAITTWVDMGKQPQPADVANLKLAMSDRRYSDFFREPSTAVVYRGFSISDEDFGKLLGGNVDVAGLPYGRGSVEGSWTIEPWKKRNAQFVSYSKSREAAVDFSKLWSDNELRNSLTVEARISDNPGVFFDLYYVVKKLNTNFFPNVDKEQEVIALGPVKVHKITWWRGGPL